jgi:hypothetical protein
VLIFFGDFLEIHDARRAIPVLRPFGSLTTCRRLSQMSLQAEQLSDVLLGQCVRAGVAESNREGSGRVGCLARMHVVRLLAKRLDNEYHSKDQSDGHSSALGRRSRHDASTTMRPACKHHLHGDARHGGLIRQRDHTKSASGRPLKGVTIFQP